MRQYWGLHMGHRRLASMCMEARACSGPCPSLWAARISSTSLGKKSATPHCPPNLGASLWALSTGLGTRDRVSWQGPDGARDGRAQGGLGQTARSFPGCREALAGAASVSLPVAPFEQQPCKAQAGSKPRRSRGCCQGQGPGGGSSSPAGLEPLERPSAFLRLWSPFSHIKLLKTHVSSKFQRGKYSSTQYVVLAESYEF